MGVGMRENKGDEFCSVGESSYVSRKNRPGGMAFRPVSYGCKETVSSAPCGKSSQCSVGTQEEGEDEPGGRTYATETQPPQP